MKIVKRIFAVVGLVLLIFMIGYLIFTGGQLYA